jgi:AraC-like DNA-binding protein
MEKGFNRQIFENLVYRFSENGIDILPILKQIGIQLDESMPLFFSSEMVGVTFEKICQRINDYRIGLKIGFQSPLSTLGIVGQIYQSCTDFGEVLEKMKHNISFLDNINTYTYELTDKYIISKSIGNDEWKRAFPIAERQVIEHNIGFSIRCKREYLGRDVKPVEIWSPYGKISNVDLLENYFTCPIRFNMPCMAIVLPIEMLKWKLPTANKDTLFLYENYVKKINQAQSTWKAQVKQVIKEQFQVGVPNILVISRQLCVSERTLQRYLKGEQSSFQEILTEVRIEMANFYKNYSSLSNAEISQRLGFEMVSSFNRFKKKFIES